jgi:hypothetical protein
MLRESRENGIKLPYDNTEYHPQQQTHPQQSSSLPVTGMMNMMILSSNTSQNRKVRTEEMSSENPMAYTYEEKHVKEAGFDAATSNKHRTNQASASLYGPRNDKIDSRGFSGKIETAPTGLAARRNSTSVTENNSLSATTKYKSHSKQKWICDHCGKVYKHPNCLSKHKWEHTDAWKETNKLSISKHQQVQLLEAASVLIGFSNPNSKEFVPKSENKISTTLLDEGNNLKNLQIPSHTTTSIMPAILSSQSLPSMPFMESMSMINDTGSGSINSTMEDAPMSGFSDDDDLESMDSNPRVFGMDF